MSAIEKKQRSSLTCPACDAIPCKCAGGGGAGDENSKSKSESKKTNNDDMSLSGDLLKNPMQSARSIQSAFPCAWCTLFASTINQLTTESSDHLQEDNASNASFSMGMKTGGMDE